MLKAGDWILTVGLILGWEASAQGQMGFSERPSFGGPAGQLPPEMAEMQKAQERLMKEAAPELYVFQKRLRDIEMKMEKITASLAKKEIDKKTAKEELRPLVKKEQEIRNDPEFQVEQRIAEAYFSSPEFQKKMKELVAQFPARAP